MRDSRARGKSDRENSCGRRKCVFRVSARSVILGRTRMSTSWWTRSSLHFRTSFWHQAYIWDQWHELIEPYATVMPYMVGMGNHEQDHLSGGSKDPSGAPGEGWHPWWGNFGDDSGGECGVPMYYRFHMPDNGNALWWYVNSLHLYCFRTFYIIFYFLVFGWIRVMCQWSVSLFSWLACLIWRISKWMMLSQN